MHIFETKYIEAESLQLLIKRGSIRHTCKHLFTAQIYPVIQLRTMLVQKVALKVVVIVPLRPIHVIQHAGVEVVKSSPRLFRDHNEANYEYPSLLEDSGRPKIQLIESKFY